MERPAGLDLSPRLGQIARIVREDGQVVADRGVQMGDLAATDPFARARARAGRGERRPRSLKVASGLFPEAEPVERLVQRERESRPQSGLLTLRRPIQGRAEVLQL